MATEEFTPEELDALKSLEGDNTPPPEEGGDDAGAGEQPPAAAASAPAAAIPAGDGTTPPATDGTSQTEDERFEAFRRLHEAKTPEDLLRLAFQQERRSNREAYDARQAREQRDQLLSRINERLQARRQNIDERRQQFTQQLNDDPDAAVKALADERFASEEAAAIAEAERAAREARVDEAFDLAARAIPDLPTRIPDIYNFGQQMNFTREELAGIDDGRQLVTLYLASLAGNMILNGRMDITGKMAPPPTAVETTDPRLKPPTTPTTLSSAPARPANASLTPAQQIESLLQMSDADFDKISLDELKRLTT